MAAGSETSQTSENFAASTVTPRRKLDPDAYTLGDVGDTWAKLTGLRESSLVPRRFSGPALGTLGNVAGGALLGRYIASPLLRWLMPDTFRNEKGTNQVLGIGGGLAGLALTYPWWSAAASGDRRMPWFNKPKPKPGDPAGDPLPTPNPPGQKKEPNRDMTHVSGPVNSPGRVKGASFGAFQQKDDPFRFGLWPMQNVERSVVSHVAQGNISPDEAANILTVNRRAEIGKTGLVSRNTFSKAVGGFAMGYLAARAATPIAETLFGKLTPREQQQLAYKGGLAGTLMNTLGDVVGD